MDMITLAHRFRTFASRECRGSSELYERLSLQTAEDEELLAIAAHSRAWQPALIYSSALLIISCFAVRSILCGASMRVSRSIPKIQRALFQASGTSVSFTETR